MYRFWPGFEPSRLTAGQEWDFSKPRTGKPYGPIPRPTDRSYGGATHEPSQRAPIYSEHRGHSSPLTVPIPSLPPRPTPEAVAQGLRLLGMSSREARMYLAFLDGPRSAREAAQVAGLHRATGYRILLRLFERGLILSQGRTPRRFRSLELSTLFYRLESFYRDESEIPGLIAEAFGSRPDAHVSRFAPASAGTEPPRILVPAGRSGHPAILELAQAKRAVAALVRPLSTPIEYRNALARSLVHVVRNGVHVRLLTDATPADNRFCRAVLREAGGHAAPIQIRHYSPLLSQFYLIDRQTSVRIPTLGASNRTPPVGVAIRDRARVQALVSRFESLWTEAAGAALGIGPGYETVRPPARDEDRLTAGS